MYASGVECAAASFAAAVISGTGTVLMRLPPESRVYIASMGALQSGHLWLLCVIPPRMPRRIHSIMQGP